LPSLAHRNWSSVQLPDVGTLPFAGRDRETSGSPAKGRINPGFKGTLLMCSNNEWQRDKLRREKVEQRESDELRGERQILKN